MRVLNFFTKTCEDTWYDTSGIHTDINADIKACMRLRWPCAASLCHFAPPLICRARRLQHASQQLQSAHADAAPALYAAQQQHARLSSEVAFWQEQGLALQQQLLTAVESHRVALRGEDGSEGGEELRSLEREREELRGKLASLEGEVSLKQCIVAACAHNKDVV